MQQEQKQKIYISIDDSGQMSEKDAIACFGGLIFFSQKEVEDFTLRYENLINKFKCKYCKNKHCPELKHSNLEKKHIKTILNYLKKYHLLSCVIQNNKIYQTILQDKKAKGRYLDYAIKMMVKNAIKQMIKENLIDPNKDLELIIYIDESSYKSNGYYDLDKSIYEELCHGISNIKNNTKFKNLLNGKLTLSLTKKKSINNYLIQASDIIAGTVRNNTLKNLDLSFINYRTFLP